MKKMRIASLSVMAATCALTFTQLDAQSLARDSGPAEIPPASFSGNQYVDSKGCVYIRAGVDGNTTWVPRVSRSRKVVCGLSPSLGGGATAVAEAPAASQGAQPVQIGANLPNVADSAARAQEAPAAVAVARPRAQQQPASQTATTIRPTRNPIAEAFAPRPVKTVASTTAAPQVRRVNIPQPRGVQAPRTVRQQAVAAQPRVLRLPSQQTAQTQRRVAAPSGAVLCQGASAVSQQFIRDRGQPRRCGPQSGSVVFLKSQVQGGTFRAANGQMLDAASIPPNARVVPRHVYEQQQAARVVQAAPQGYRQAWTDDRLNTRRTHQTLAGKAQSDLIWTQTVPRRLIIARTGRDVTRIYPGLRYPYTSIAQQNAALRSGVAQGVTISTKSQPRATRQQVVRQQRVTQQQARVSTRAVAPQRQVVAAPAGKRFVQVGTFGNPSNAQRTARQLQRMGMPVRIGKTRKGLQIVMAGPFRSSAHVGGALTAVRNAGFRDAFARN